MSANECLSDRELKAFQTGALPEAAQDDLADHVSSCHRCQVAVLQLGDLSDRALKSLQRATGESCWAEAPVSESGSIDYDALRQKAAANVKYPFLSPPKQAGDIGTLAGYRIKRLLGRGGMGMVFLAEDSQLQRPIALKVILPDQADELEARLRFLREARSAAAVKHPHVITIYQVGQENDVCFLAMELLEGEALDSWLRRHPRPRPADVIRLGRQMALGLAAVHDRGLIHRDFKPTNVWLEGEEQHVKLLDFGLVQNAADKEQLTETGLIVGTPAYMAPEQARGFALDGRCDLFSLGCVLYRLLTGRVPFAGETTMAVLTALAVDDVEPIESVSPEVPKPLADLVMRLLDKEPIRRPESARVVAETLAAMERQAPTVHAPVALLVAEPVDTSSRAMTRALFADAVAPRPEELTCRAEPLPLPKRSSRRRFQVVAVGLTVVLTMTVVALLPRGSQKPATGPAPVVAAAPKPTPNTVAEVKRPVTAPAKQVEALKAALKERNPGFNPSALIAGIDNGVVVGISITRTPVADLSPLQAIPTLKSLSLQHLPNEVSLAGLKGLPLQWLDFNGTLITDFAPLADMPLVSLEGAPKNGDLTPLRNVKTLTRLMLAGPSIRDLTPLADLPLEQFSCARSGVTDLTPLRGVTTLKNLTISETSVRSLAPLSDLRLTWLDCRQTRVTDLTPLAGMKLTYLDVARTSVRDLAPLTDMPLEKFDCSDTLVQDLTPLAGSRLVSLNCRTTKVRDLTPLKDVKLFSLDCSDTQVTDLTPLQQVKTLRELACDFDAKRDTAILQSIKSLQTINRQPAAEFLKQAK